MSPTCRTTTTDGGQPVGDSLGSEVTSVLDMLWGKLEAIHELEMTKALARRGAASGETRAAIEALSVAIVRTVFDRCAAVLRERDPSVARNVSELFDLRSCEARPPLGGASGTADSPEWLAAGAYPRTATTG